MQRFERKVEAFLVFDLHPGVERFRGLFGGVQTIVFKKASNRLKVVKIENKSL